MQDIANRAQSIRRKIIQTANSRFDGHFGGCLSAVDILAVLFGGVMNVSPERTGEPSRDRFVLSKGHCALALFATLNEFGFLSDDELASFHAEGSAYQTHAVKNVAKGIEISSGSLAMGFSMACGIAEAIRMRHLDSKVFVLVGNGEANEGLFWEAAAFAGSKSLSNLCLVMDDNGMQNDGDSAKVLQIVNWTDRLRTFGWTVAEADGHDHSSLKAAFASDSPGKPLFVHATTVKGKGVPFMENAQPWHHNKMSPDQYSEAIASLGGETP